MDPRVSLDTVTICDDAREGGHVLKADLTVRIPWDASPDANPSNGQLIAFSEKIIKAIEEALYPHASYHFIVHDDGGMTRVKLQGGHITKKDIPPPTSTASPP